MFFINNFWNSKISNKQLALFLIIYLFLINIIFVLVKGFISNEERSDLIFFIISFFIIEILSFIFYKNNFDNYLNENTNYFTLYFILGFLYLIWNELPINSYLNIVYYFTFLIVNIFLFINFLNNIYDLKKKEYLLIFVISIYISGILYGIDYSYTNNFFLHFITLVCIYIFFRISKKINLSLDLFLSIFIFIILAKVFLISSEKDSFHYSWYLGPINSLLNYNLYEEVVSQYGFLNIMAIHKINIITKINSNLALLVTIISMMIIFFSIFFKELNKIVSLPFFLITFFLSLLLFGNLGYSNLIGSIFIPSASVFRFLPSIITIILFSKIFDEKSLLNKKYLYLFVISFIISGLWSFESLFFTCLPLSVFFLFKVFFNSKSILSFFNLINFKLIFNKFYFFTILISLCFLIFLLSNLKDKDLIFFYEFALLTSGSLSEEIIKNDLSLLFLFFILSGYLILRDSFRHKDIFYNNLLFFTLLLSFSVYYLNRSVDGNVFSLLPFFIYFICLMKIKSYDFIFYRKIIIYLIIIFSIISSAVSIFLNYEKFKKNLFSNKFVLPIFQSSDFMPSKKVMLKINKFKNTPVTLITKYNVHNINNNLPNLGYGMPILPLEMFSILSDKRKNYLFETFFIKHKNHLVLCTIDCEFYSDSNDQNIRYKIFIGDNFKLEKIFENKSKYIKENLFLISKIE